MTPDADIGSPITTDKTVNVMMMEIRRHTTTLISLSFTNNLYEMTLNVRLLACVSAL